MNIKEGKRKLKKDSEKANEILRLSLMTKIFKLSVGVIQKYIRKNFR